MSRLFLMNLLTFSGNLGATRGALMMAIHANWPAYPAGEDYLETIFQLTAFPTGMEFVVVDDIDRALLLVADVRGRNLAAPYEEENFHISAWHEDLAELQELGLIEGIRPATERQWRKAQWDELSAKHPGGLYMRDENGKLSPAELPSLDQYDDDEEWKPFVVAPTRRIRVSAAGREHVHAKLKDLSFDIAANLSKKVQTNFYLGYFDTCIREACVQFEHEIRTKIASDAYGVRLVESYIEHLRSKGIFLESWIRTYRQEVRSVFKLIRNDFMHNLAELDELSAHVMLVRIARARSALEI